MFGRNVVINFHAVEDESWFERMLKYLRKKYRIISVEELFHFYSSKKEMRNTCLLTFDDGHVSFYSKVFPLLQKHNTPCVIFVSPDVVVNGVNFWTHEIQGYDDLLLKQVVASIEGICMTTINNIPAGILLKNFQIDRIWRVICEYQRRTATEPKAFSFLNMEQLRDISHSGLVSIGAHTLSHPILANESEQRATLEITKSVEDLGRLLNCNIEYFAYPNGIPDLDFGPREFSILRKLNIKLAFSTENRFLSQEDNLLSIPRTGLVNETLFKANVKLELGPAWPLLKSVFSVSETALRGRMEHKPIVC